MLISACLLAFPHKERALPTLLSRPHLPEPGLNRAQVLLLPQSLENCSSC